MLAISYFAIFSLTQMLAISAFFCCYFLFTQMLTISAIFRSLDVLFPLFGVCFTTISAILLFFFSPYFCYFAIIVFTLMLAISTILLFCYF